MPSFGRSLRWTMNIEILRAVLRRVEHLLDGVGRRVDGHLDLAAQLVVAGLDRGLVDLGGVVNEVKRSRPRPRRALPTTPPTVPMPGSGTSRTSLPSRSRTRARSTRSSGAQHELPADDAGALEDRVLALGNDLASSAARSGLLRVDAEHALARRALVGRDVEVVLAHVDVEVRGDADDERMPRRRPCLRMSRSRRRSSSSRAGRRRCSQWPSRERSPPRKVSGCRSCSCTTVSFAGSAPSAWKRSSAKPGRSATRDARRTAAAPRCNRSRRPWASTTGRRTWRPR